MSDPRDIILRRRAVFLSMTLSGAIGCNGGGQSSTSGGPPVVPVPMPPSASVTNTAGPPAPAPTDPPTAPPPGYDLPAGISDEAKANYERLHTTMREVHGKLDEVERGLPGCDIQDVACEGRYRALAEKLHEVRRTLNLFYICPGTSEDAKAFAPHYEAHRKFVFEREKKVVASVGDHAEGVAKGGNATWAAVQKSVAQSKPYPCLSFACRDW